MEHPWKGIILNRFLSADKNGQEKEYYPPYNLLLYTHFPPTENYIVAPVTHPLATRDAIDFTIEYVIEMNNKPVFVLEVKPPKSINNKSSRSDADRQIRRRLGDIIDLCPINTLYGVSAFGTLLAFYNVNKLTKQINPPAIPDSDTVIVDTAPITWWNNNLTDIACANVVDNLFNEIKKQCANLNTKIQSD